MTIDWPLLKELLVAGCAVLGATLGVINTLHSLNQRRVRLRVVPKMAQQQGNGLVTTPTDRLTSGWPCIEVINLSAFPVTITEVGFRWKDAPGGQRLALPTPQLFDGKPWPRRLESHETVTAHCLDTIHQGVELGKAYATTDCGQTRYGDSAALKQLRQIVRMQGHVGN